MMLKRLLLTVLVAAVPAGAWAQPEASFEILTWLDNEWTVLDANGATVRTLDIQPAGPGFLNLSDDGTKLLIRDGSWQTWEHDFSSAASRFLFYAEWNAASTWLAASSSRVLYNDASGRLLEFDTSTGNHAVWQLNDTVGQRAFTRVEFADSAPVAVMNIHFPGAGGMGVYLADRCNQDPLHALCNIRALAWPGNGSTSWSDVAANGVLTSDGLTAVYFERRSSSTGSVYLHDVPGGSRVPLLSWTSNTEISGNVYGPFADRYVVINAPSHVESGSTAYFICDIHDRDCREILRRPGTESLSHVALARRFGGDSLPPVITVPDDLVVEATSAAGAEVSFNVTAVDDVDGPVGVSCTPSSGSTFPLGTTRVHCTATDGAGNTSTHCFNVTVTDTTPPSIDTIAPSVEELWPPNGEMVDVAVVVAASDIVTGEAECRISAVEVTAPLGDSDWELTGDMTVKLRARRPGTSAMRYLLTVTCDDGANTSAAQVAVVVPHDQRR